MKMRVFVFDDDESIGALLTRCLGRWGHEVTVFDRATACLACQCSTGHLCADVLLSDASMPGLTGVEFSENQVIAGCRVQNIALMSGAWTAEELARARTIGCRVFHKPLPLHELQAWLEECAARIEPSRTLAPHYERRTPPA